MDKTYSEACGIPSFDWRKALQDALEKKPDDQTWLTLIGKARGWVTCACGNQCAIIERDLIGGPRDHLLRAFGLEFMQRIENQDWSAALATLNKLEARAQTLIQRELSKLQRAHV